MDESAINTARTNASTSANNAAKFQSQGYTVADELRKALGERYGESDIARSTAEARGTFLAQAPQDRQAVADMVSSGTILSPTQQNAIMAAKRGAAIVPLEGANLINNATFGTMEDLINAGTNAFQAQSSYATSQAQQAQQIYQSLMDEAVKRAQMKQIEEELKLKAAMAPFEQQYKQAQIAGLLADAKKTGSGGGGSTPNLVLQEVTNSETGEVRIDGIDPKTNTVVNSRIITPGKAKGPGIGASISGGLNWLGNQVKSSWDWLGRPQGYTVDPRTGKTQPF